MTARTLKCVIVFVALCSAISVHLLGNWKCNPESFVQHTKRSVHLDPRAEEELVFAE